MLGLTLQDLLDNDTIQAELTKRDTQLNQKNALIQNEKKGGEIVKVHNI